MCLCPSDCILSNFFSSIFSFTISLFGFVKFNDYTNSWFLILAIIYFYFSKFCFFLSWLFPIFYSTIYFLIFLYKHFNKLNVKTSISVIIIFSISCFCFSLIVTCFFMCFMLYLYCDFMFFIIKKIFKHNSIILFRWYMSIILHNFIWRLTETSLKSIPSQSCVYLFYFFAIFLDTAFFHIAVLAWSFQAILIVSSISKGMCEKDQT